MSELKRYELMPEGGYPTSGVMRVTEDGEWVAYDDVRKMTDWQPIETAPMDGTEIIVWGGTFFHSSEDYSEEKADFVRLVRRYVDWTHKEGVWRGDESGDHYFIHRPTHWQPLPAPPQVASESGGGG